jgi:hypothetical protein
MSVSSYVRIRCPLEEGMARYGRWIGAPEVQSPRLVSERDMFDLAVVDGQWLGLAVFIYASGPWTVIEEVSGGLALRSAESWLDLAQGGDLVFAAYDDTVPYARLVVVERGRLVREYLQDEQDSSHDVDVGRLLEEERQGFKNWIAVMVWIEEDEDKLTHPQQGWLWIHRSTEPDTSQAESE